MLHFIRKYNLPLFVNKTLRERENIYFLMRWKSCIISFPIFIHRYYAVNIINSQTFIFIKPDDTEQLNIKFFKIFFSQQIKFFKNFTVYKWTLR